MSKKSWDVGDEVSFVYGDPDETPGTGVIEEIQASIPAYNVRTSLGGCVTLYDHEMTKVVRSRVRGK